MKQALFFTLAMGLFDCNQQPEKTQVLQNRIDDLETKHAATYKPGFGEFMSSIQAHHAKLWFAGQRQNWKLADFEIHELMEAIENIKNYQTERNESKEIGMISPALDSVNKAITHESKEAFISSYRMLTNTCNACHRATAFEFNIVKIPKVQTFSNQEFKIPQ